jgi:hypothetical protein
MKNMIATDGDNPNTSVAKMNQIRVASPLGKLVSRGTGF